MHRLRKAALIGVAAAVMVLLGGGAPRESVAQSSREISEAESGLTFDGPGLDGGYRGFFTSSTVDGHDRQVIGLYGSPAGALPRAEILFMQAAPGRHITREIPLDELLALWEFLATQEPTVAEPRETRNAIGRIRYALATTANTRCVLFAQAFGPRDLRGFGDKAIYGFYCAAPDSAFDAAAAEAVVMSVGHRAFGAPSGPNGQRPAASQDTGIVKTPFTAWWEGYRSDVTGQMTIAGRRRFNLALSDGGSCEGDWMPDAGEGATGPSRGRWTMLCDNGLAAEGTYVRTAEGAGIAEGTDREGSRVRLRFGSP